MLFDPLSQFSSWSPARLSACLARLGRWLAAASVAAFVQLAPAPGQTPSEPNTQVQAPSNTQPTPPQEQNSEQEKGATPDAGIRMAPVGRPPVMNRPAAVQRPMITRPISRGNERQISVNRRSTSKKQTTKTDEIRPVDRTTRKTGTKIESQKKVVDKPAAVDKATNKPAAIDKPANIEKQVIAPVTPSKQTDRPNVFAGKPDSVSHNPLHGDGELGKTADHKPQTIEKYGKYYSRNYYSETVEGRQTWYWYDTLVDALPPLVRVPVCSGDTDDCPLRPMLPAIRKTETGIHNVCEMQWVGGGNGPRQYVECVQGSSGCTTKCELHGGGEVLPQPSPMPGGTERNSYWCGC